MFLLNQNKHPGQSKYTKQQKIVGVVFFLFSLLLLIWVVASAGDPNASQPSQRLIDSPQPL